jgi:phosphate transport system permease protein
MTSTQLSELEILRAPLPRVGQLVLPAARTACLAAAVVPAIAGAVVLTRLGGGVPLDLGKLIVWTAAWSALAFIVFLGLRLFVLSRRFAETSFAYLGLGATFFGLAMLLVFFAQLGAEAYDWFTLTPQLVERHNQFLKQRVEETESNIQKVVKELEVEMALEISRAANDAEKKEMRQIFETEIIPERVKDLRLTADEYRRDRDLGVRDDVSPLGLIGYFLANGPSNEPQNAGIFPALIGSLIVSMITILAAVPIGVGAALYLEEYRSNSLLSRIIQININNLAGVPSVVYGILGGFVFVEMIFKPMESQFEWISARNVLGGGLTLALLTLPVIIVATQEAIRAVPSSIREGAYALGATRWQTIWRQVLPLAWPGIMTGTILSLSRAIGEAAPLVLFGALLFVDQVPGLFSRFTVLPMQIFGWADRPPELLGDQRIEIWRANAAMGCIVLLVTLLGLNAIAIMMRNRAQRKLKW